MTDLGRNPGFDPERLLEAAELLLGVPERREEAEGLALRVLEAIPAGQPAVRARRLLDELDRRSISPRSCRDPGLETARDDWAALSGLDDGRLMNVWTQTAGEPQRFAALRSEIERQLRGWIRVLIRDIRRTARQGGDDPQRRLAVLDTLTATAAFDDHFEMALRDILEELRVAVFELRLAEHESEILQALNRWQVERARELLDVLGEPPAGVAANPLPEHRQRLEEIAERQQEIEQLRARLEQVEPPSNWLGLRRSLELLAEGQAWRAEPVPQAIREILEIAIGGARARVRRFIDQAVRSAADLDALRELGGNLEQLESRFQAAAVELGASIFEPAVATLERTWKKLLGAAEAPADIAALADEVMRDGGLLPAPLATVSRRWSKRLGKIADTWQTLRRGEPFEPLPPEEVPPRCRAEQDKQQEIARKLADGFRLLEATPVGAKRAREIAEQVLESFPDHAQAIHLAQVAERREIARDLDCRLGGLEDHSFDLDAYCEVASWDEAPEAHRALAEHREVLTELVRLFGEPPLGTTEAAVAWWTCFAQVAGLVPDAAVPILKGRLAEEGRARRAQWGLVLDEALAEERVAAEWQRIAAGLEEVAGDPRFDAKGELERYQTELLRRAELARIADLLDHRHWDRARDALKKVEGDPERSQNLEVRLAVEGAFARGDLLAFADALDKGWGRAVQIYGAVATEKLMAGISASWEAHEQAALDVLRSVARRARRATDRDSQIGRRLENWLEWLELEEKANGGLHVLSVPPLLDHIQALESAARCQRAGRLIATWRSMGYRTALAWAFRAWPELRAQLFPDDIDPVDGVAAEIAQVVATIDDWLVSPCPDEVDPVTTLAQQAQSHRQRGQGLKDEARELGFLLDELPFAVARFVPDRALDRALGQVESVVCIAEFLAALAVSDLRRESDRRDRCRTRIQELPRSVPWRSLLAAQLDRLEPLTRLVYDENRVKEAARRCGDPDALDVSRAFTVLVEALQVVIDKLATAGCSQAPVAIAIAREYWRDLPRMAGSRTREHPSGAPAVLDLVAHFEALERNEQRFREAIHLLSQQEPPLAAGGYVELQRHRDYLALVPAELPASDRALGLFERFLRFGERPTLFESAAEARLVPAWVSSVLEGGIL